MEAKTKIAGLIKNFFHPINGVVIPNNLMRESFSKILPAVLKNQMSKSNVKMSNQKKFFGGKCLVRMIWFWLIKLKRKM